MPTILVPHLDIVMSESPYKIIATLENFVPSVVEASATQPVLVDFWAPWCGPCRQLMPMLDRIADDYAGRFVLAKVNTDEQQQVAAHFGIRSIPTVMLFHNGQPVEQFVGVQPEPAIRALLDKYVGPAAAEPDPADRPPSLAETATLQLDVRDTAAATATIEQIAAQDPDDKRLKPLRARLALTEAVVAHPDFASLRAALERDPSDHGARHALAAHHALSGDYATAFAEWIELMRRDRRYGDDLARRSLLMAFDLLGPADELVASYRRKLASLLH
jgi:putative thioredoxin